MVFLKIQYQHSCYIERKKKLKCLSIWWGERKNENVRVRQKENLEKALFDWFKGMQMNNLPISGTILREKATSYAQKLQVEEFMLQMDDLKVGRLDSVFLSKLYLEKKKQ